MDIDNAFDFPVALTYKTRSHSSKDKLRSGIYGAVDAASYNYYGCGNFKDAAASFITNLFDHMEFCAGLTPGYITGVSSSYSTSVWGGPNNEEYERTWVEKPYSFSLSLDLGAGLSYRIWRFDLKIIPVLHYYLTQNFEFNTYYMNTHWMQFGEKARLVRWFCTINGGLSFNF